MAFLLLLGMTIKEAFEQTKAALQAQMEDREAENVMRILFEDAFDWTSGQPARSFLAKEQDQLSAILERLQANEPLQYILGEADFYGLKFEVTPAVLIPRPETEELVFQILEAGKNKEGQKGLDIGTGSGCIPISLKKNRPDWSLTGMDISEEALQVARRNALKNEVEVNWIVQDVLDEEAWDKLGRYDFIVSNPPYIPLEEKKVMPRQVLDYEPALALFVENDNALVFYRKIHDLAIRSLSTGGSLFFELNEFNARAVQAMVDLRFFTEAVLLPDMQGKDRMLYCQKR